MESEWSQFVVSYFYGNLTHCTEGSSLAEGESLSLTQGVGSVVNTCNTA